MTGADGDVTVRKKMMGRGAVGGCGTDERPCPVSRVPVKILATLSEVSEKAISSVGVDFFSQSKKSLCLCSPFDGSDEGLVSTVPTLPSGLASFLLRQSGSLKRHKQPHSGVEKTSYRPSKKSKIPNIWVETEEYFKDLTMADIDALSEVSLFGTSATWKYFFISVLGNARGVHEGGFSEEKMKFSNENVNFVIDEEDDGQSMEIDSVEDAEISQKETSSSSVSEPSVGLEWLSGYRNKICPATERPSKKRKLLGVDAGLEKELVASSCDGNTSLCNFCSSDDLEKELNWLVSCSSCQISVHQKFYGVQEDVDLSCPCSWCKQMTGSNDSNNNLLDFEGVELSTSISLNEGLKHGDISCFEVPLYSNSCRIHATKYSRCKEMTCNADGVRLEKFVLDRKMGILDFSPKDEVEGEIIYYQNRLLSNAIAREHFTDNLKFNIAKRLPQEIDLACMSRWDDVLVTQYLYELREAKKQGRKERRHKEVQAALSVAASNSPSSFRT